MTKETELLGKNVIITGLREVKIKDFQALFEHIQERIKGSNVQFFDARLIAGWEHLYFATFNALRAFEAGLNISRNPAIEALLYVSGQHQIKKAMETLGIKPDTSEIAVLIISETKMGAEEALKIVSDLLKGKICDDVLRLTEEKMESIKTVFNISDLELEAASRGESLGSALTDLVIEHVALLAVKR